MSQKDLDSIQTKLKMAIQNHQTLVTKLKSDPKNQLLRIKLRELQADIMSLSESQKNAVQNLRKEIVQKQVQPAIVQHYVSIAPQPVAITNISQAKLLQYTTTAALQKSSNILFPQNFVTTCNPAPLSYKVENKQQVNNIINNTNRGTSPPIRVPQYGLSSKPLILPSANANKPVNNVVKDKVSQTNAEAKVNNMDTKMCIDKKSVDDKQKMQFMAGLDLITPDSLEELQSKKHERKRRSTANPQFSYIEPEKKNRLTGYMLNHLQSAIKRGRGRPPKYGPSPNNSRPSTPNLSNDNKLDSANTVESREVEEYLCDVCKRGGQVLQCNSCYKVFHMNCLDTPLSSIPTGYWCCSSCQLNDKVFSLNGTQSIAVVNSYIATKTVKEDEKRKLQRRATDLMNERTFLEAKTKELTENLSSKLKCNQELSDHNKLTKQNMDNLSNFIKSLQK